MAACCVSWGVTACDAPITGSAAGAGGVAGAEPADDITPAKPGTGMGTGSKEALRSAVRLGLGEARREDSGRRVEPSRFTPGSLPKEAVSSSNAAGNVPSERERWSPAGGDGGGGCSGHRRSDPSVRFRCPPSLTFSSPDWELQQSGGAPDGGPKRGSGRQSSMKRCGSTAAPSPSSLTPRWNRWNRWSVSVWAST